MFYKYFRFYFISFFFISILLFLFHTKMQSTYEAKNNFNIFNQISNQFSQHEDFNIPYSSFDRATNIQVIKSIDTLNISINDVDYRSCLKYGIEYIDSNFQSISINSNLFNRKKIITRDIILENCNKTFNNIILTQQLEKQ